MRWFWIDRFLEFESGRSAVAIKNVSLVEEVIDEYIPGQGLLPSTLIIEGIAQTGGLLIGEAGGFQERVVLAKVAKAVFHFPATPGDSLIYSATVEDIRPGGGICVGTSHRGDELQAEVELVFAFLDDRFEGVDLFDSADFLRMLRLLRLYDVGRTPEGQPLVIPPHLREAEEEERGRGSALP